MPLRISQVLGYIDEEICDMGHTFEEVPVKCPEEFEPDEDWDSNEEEFRAVLKELREKVTMKGFVKVLGSEHPPAWLGKADALSKDGEASGGGGK